VYFKWWFGLGVLLLPAWAAHAQSGRDGKVTPHGNEAFTRVEVHYSILTDLADRSNLAPAFGYAIKGGYRWGNIGAFVGFEQNFWVATEFEVRVVQGAYNIAAGLDFTYFDGRAHTAIAFGPSILAFDTPLDEKGKVGWVLDFRPIGVQWDVHRNVRLGLDPLSFAVVAPVPDGIPLVQVQYRTTFYVETPF
jgi:hypothetical protein